MDFQFDDVQQQIDQMTRDFATKEVRPLAAGLMNINATPLIWSLVWQSLAYWG